MELAKDSATAGAERLLSEMVGGLSAASKSLAAQATGPNGANKGPWTKEEDEMLIQLVNEYGTKQWSVVASHLKVRPGRLRLTTCSTPWPTLTYAVACACRLVPASNAVNVGSTTWIRPLKR